MFVSEFQVSGENRQFKFVFPEICTLNALKTFVVQNTSFVHQFGVWIEHCHFSGYLAKTCTISVAGALLAYISAILLAIL